MFASVALLALARMRAPADPRLERVGLLPAEAVDQPPVELAAGGELFARVELDPSGRPVALLVRLT